MRAGYEAPGNRSRISLTWSQDNDETIVSAPQLQYGEAAEDIQAKRSRRGEAHHNNLHQVSCQLIMMEFSLNTYHRYITDLVRKGGPTTEDFADLQQLFHAIAWKKRNGQISDGHIRKLRNAFGDALSFDTLQGYSMLQPHGYAGDYEIIDRIHTSWISPKTNLQKWDYFYHSQAASTAVRNRKTYFQDVLINALNTNNGRVTVLNVGSGPGRDMYDFFRVYPDADISIECVDSDSNAIRYASALNRDFLKGIAFHRKNIFRFKPAKKYDLIWSAGLFDYLNDRSFCYLLHRLLEMITPCGQIIVGNFSPSNPSRDYMEFGNWILHHRDADQLYLLTRECNIPNQSISIYSEQEGVNLFLHIQA